MRVEWAKKVPSFLSYFKTQSIGLVLGIEPQTAPTRPQSNRYSYVQILLQLLGEILLEALQFSLAYVGLIHCLFSDIQVVVFLNFNLA